MTWLDLPFRSGMSSKSDLRGAIEAGVPVGVVAGLLTTSAMVMVIPRYLDRGGKVFVDSGAFGAFLSGEEMDWREIMSRYLTLANMTDHPENLYVVAPDKVGDQAGTMAVLEAWAPKVRALVDEGCQVIVPIQAGSLPGQEMIERAAVLLGTRKFIVGVPSNRAAMSIEECRTLRHAAFHILGRVQADEEQIERIYALREGNPCAQINADANWLRSRMDTVRKGTEAERELRCAAALARALPPVLLIDHPRVEAVRRALEEDQDWGAKPAPRRNDQLELVLAA